MIVYQPFFIVKIGIASCFFAYYSQVDFFKWVEEYPEIYT